jgi:phosphatidate cytidylyltransferase
LASEEAVFRVQSELVTRVIAGAVMAPVALAAALLGGLPFALFLAVVAALGFWEWTAVTPARDPLWPRLVGLVGLVVGLFALSIARTDLAIGVIVLPAFLALVGGYFRQNYCWLGLGLVYVALPSAALVVLRHPESGWAAVLFIFLVVWATDIGGYFGGRQFGGPKLWPRISPKKTWSGAVAGLTSAMVVGGITVWATSPENTMTGILLAAPLSIAAQAGDLLESAVKRRFGVKDSGQIIPGHGGVLDRVDGLFGAAALAWLLAAVGLGGEILVLPPDIVALSRGAS